MFSAHSIVNREAGHPFCIEIRADGRWLCGKGGNDWGSEPSPLFLGGLCLVADEGPVFINLAVEILHGLVSFRSGRHLDKGEALGTTGKLIRDQIGGNDAAIGPEKGRKFRFGDIEGKTTDKKFHTGSPLT